jgi:hypothetical protein
LQDEGKAPAEEVLHHLMQSDLTVEQLCELHGLYRHWGHPTVNSKDANPTAAARVQTRVWSCGIL